MIVSTVLPSLVPPRHIDDCSAIHNLHWELCDLRWWSHQNVPLKGTTVPARLLQEALVIFVFKQISQFGSFGRCENTLCLPEPRSTFARGSIGNSWEELAVSRYPSSRYPVALKDYVHRLNSLSEILQPVRQVMQRIALYFFASCVFIFVSGFYWFMKRVSRISFLYLIFDVSVVMKMMTKQAWAVVEELVDKPRATNGTQFDFLQSILLPFLVRCVFDHWSSGKYTHDPRSASSFFKKHNCHEQVQFLDIYRHHHRRTSRCTPDLQLSRVKVSFTDHSSAGA